MKRILIILFITVCSLTGIAQTPVFADPAVGSLDITNIAGIQVDANALELGTVYLLKLTIFNLSQSTAIPQATCRIRVGLGTRLIIDPAFNLPNAAMNQFFNWTSQPGSQVQIFGDLYITLPADFIGTLSFGVKANVLGNSTASGQFLISNNNPAFTLSDLDPNNNGATLNYKVVEVIPVKFMSVTGRVQDCEGSVNWKVGVEDNVDHYELEYSNDGASFTKCNSIPANGLSSYTLATGDIKLHSSTVFFRVKSVDRDGSFAYSEIILLKGFCYLKDNSMLELYPNPLTGNILNLKFHVPEGAYDIMMFDAIGQAVFSTRIMHSGGESSYQVTFKQELSAGTYYALLLGRETRLSKKFIKE